MILYFTGTGNSLFAARAVAEVTGDSLISMNDLLRSGEKGVFRSEKPFVIVSPIYAWRLPQRVEALLRAAEFSGDRRAYFVVTMGSQSGSCDRYCEKLCTEKSLRFMGLQGVVMPNNYVVSSPMPDAGAVEQKLDSALPVLRQIGADILSGCQIHKTDRTFAAGLMSGAVNRMFNRFALRGNVLSCDDRCIGCGNCAELCPTNNIVLQGGKPEFSVHCMSCFSCIQRCPVSAINVKGKTEKRGRYVCPDYLSYTTSK